MIGRAKIAVLDYGMGNLRSVQKALEHVDADVVVVRTPEAAAEAEALVLPGVGAFPKAMAAVERQGLDRLVAARAESGSPILGICLGMQLLFEGSSELGGSSGLALLPGVVEPLPADGLQLPQIGWNPVRWLQRTPLVEGLADSTPMYHVHSYAPLPDDPDLVLGVADYGAEFVTAVTCGAIHGVQFHPEKSGPAGLRLLANFARLVERAPAASA